MSNNYIDESFNDRLNSFLELQDEPEVSETEETPIEDGETEVSFEDGDETSDDVSEATEEPNEDADEEPYHEVIIDGKSEKVTLKEALRGYQREQDYSRKTAALSIERQALEAERNTIKQQYEQTYQQAISQALAGAYADPILEEARNTDWLQLSQTDPAEFIQRKARFEARQGQIQHLEYQKAQHLKAQKEEWVRTEQAKTFERIPEWRDDKIRQREIPMILNYLKGHGFSDNDLNNLVDARQIALVRTAALFHEQHEAKKSMSDKKVVKTSSPTVKTGPATIKSKAKDPAALKRGLAPGASRQERALALARNA